MADHTQPDSGFDLAVSIWRRRKWVALGVFLALVAASLSFTLSLPPIYRSTTTVLVERPMSEGVVRPAVTSDLEARLQTISQEVLSRARLEQLISRFDLYPELRRREATQEMVIDQMRRDIQLEPKVVEQAGGRQATIGFALSYRGRKSQTVADVTNALASFYVEQNLKIRERQTAGTTAFLKTQLSEMKKKLDEQERRIGATPHDATADLAAAGGLNTRLRLNSDHQMRAMDRRERLLKELRETGTTTGAVPSAADLPTARLAKLKAELVELRTRFSDKYPDVIRIKAEIAEVERSLPAAAPSASTAAVSPAAPPSKDPLSEVEAELRTLKDEERRLRQSISLYEARLESAPRIQQEFQRQARDYVATKDLYESLLKRYEDAQMAENIEQGQRGEQFRVLDAAVPSRAPIAPHRPRLALIGFLLSVGLAAVAVVLVERMDTSFHSVDALRSFTRVPVVVSIPRLMTHSDTVRHRRRLWLGAAAAVVGVALIGALVYVLAHGNSQLVRVFSPGS
ncbi:MAG TPA: GNVR domain-containing protein [Methylomirabilota bacterium]|jgi:polysaccharide chain length determinant protein (PEP-CTERM system associated)|nr:GNVR domain-containing protein [Methylomirabilota bacterium]